MSVVLHDALPRQTVAQSTDSPQKIVLKMVTKAGYINFEKLLGMYSNVYNKQMLLG